MPNTASARRPKPKRRSRHTVLRILSGLCALVAVVGVVARALPEQLQALPYVPVMVSATPWFVVAAVLALLFALISRRWIVALVAVACIGLEVWWQSNCRRRLPPRWPPDRRIRPTGTPV